MAEASREAGRVALRWWRRWPGWIGYVAAAWSLAYGLLGRNWGPGDRRVGAGGCGGGGDYGPDAGTRSPSRGTARLRLGCRRDAGPGNPRLPRARGGGLHAHRPDRRPLRLAAGSEHPRRLPLAGGEPVCLHRWWASVGRDGRDLRATEQGRVRELRPGRRRRRLDNA